MVQKEKNWKFLPGWEKKKPKGDLPLWFLNILASRGLKNEKEIEAFLHPKYEDLMDPDSFTGMKEAVEIVARAKEENWKVTVYGDYDVDGVTSTALMHDVLKKIGIKEVETYIPHREAEGYGLNKEALTEIFSGGTKLLVSVDCGIGSGDLIAEFKGDERHFLVVDHHEIDAKKLPKDIAIIHPELTKKGVTPQKLSAAGIGFYLALALQKHFPEKFLPGQEKWLLDLVSLSTIADVMPLAGQNRILAKYGLKVLEKTKRIGLKELYKVASIDPSDISAYSVGFLIAPRLNAAGRLEHAKVALDLLLTNDPKEAVRLAGELNRFNVERQKLCERILTEAIAEIEGSDKKEHEIFLLSNKNWPRGVVGIIAGRLAESYARPVIVFEHDQEGHHGSARSVGDFDITAALSECEGCLERFGGHAKAAGLSVSDEKFVVFSDKILEITRKRIKKSDLVKEIKIDTEITEKEITDEAVDYISQMEPFGYGNTTPVLAVKKASVASVKMVGADQNHLKFQLKDSGLSGIFFNQSEKLDEKKQYDIAFNLKYNVWNNRKTIDLRVVDIRKS
jgi:single-stranded-DNA-specific exonuclease